MMLIRTRISGMVECNGDLYLPLNQGHGVSFPPVKKANLKWPKRLILTSIRSPFLGTDLESNARPAFCLRFGRISPF
jgi:hypothetical protein